MFSLIVSLISGQIYVTHSGGDMNSYIGCENTQFELSAYHEVINSLVFSIHQEVSDPLKENKKRNFLFTPTS